MKYYPENTVARYTTKLDNTIELEGEWEVGLVEIWTPTDLVNVTDVTTPYTSTGNTIGEYCFRRHTTVR